MKKFHAPFFCPYLCRADEVIHLFILIFKDMKETTMMTTMSGMMDAEQRMTSLTHHRTGDW